MWNRACALLTAVLAVGLVATRRRLRDAQAELERMRAEAADARTPAAGPELAAGSVGSQGAESGQPAEVDAGASDMASEWEQAVPPMDS
jgi:hypothetical protein